MRQEPLFKGKISQRQQPRIEIVPSPALVDDKPLVRLVGFEPGQLVTLHASMEMEDKLWSSSATFIVDPQGTVDVESREDAQMIIPPQHRANARVIQLRRWTKEEIADMVNALDA